MSIEHRNHCSASEEKPGLLAPPALPLTVGLLSPGSVGDLRLRVLAGMLERGLQQKTTVSESPSVGEEALEWIS